MGGRDSYSGAPPQGARLSKVSSKRLCTEAMLQVLQQEIRKGRRRSSMSAAETELVIAEPLGRGGFGHVYRGTWHTAPAAIKVGRSGGPRAARLNSRRCAAPLRTLAAWASAALPIGPALGAAPTLRPLLIPALCRLCRSSTRAPATARP